MSRSRNHNETIFSNHWKVWSVIQFKFLNQTSSGNWNFELWRYHCIKTKFCIKNFLSKCGQICRIYKTTFVKETLNGKLFLFSLSWAWYSPSFALILKLKYLNSGRLKLPVKALLTFSNQKKSHWKKAPIKAPNLIWLPQ